MVRLNGFANLEEEERDGCDGHPFRVLPHVLSISFRDVPISQLMSKLLEEVLSLFCMECTPTFVNTNIYVIRLAVTLVTVRFTLSYPCNGNTL